MIEHNLYNEPDFMSFENQMNELQLTQIKKEQKETNEKEQNISQKQEKAEEQILDNSENKEFNKWLKNAPAVYELNENDYSKDQWLEEFKEAKISKPEQTYLISNSQDGQTAQKAIEAYEIAIDYLNRRYISPDNTEKQELSIELADKNTIDKIDKKTQKYLDNSDIAISYDEAFREAVLDNTKSFKKILNNGLEKERQRDIEAANEELKEDQKLAEINFQNNRYSFKNWKETNNAKEHLDKIEKLPYAKEQNIKEFGSIDKWLENVYNITKEERPHEIVFDIELNNKEQQREANQKLANKLGYKDIYELEENETKPTIEKIRDAHEITNEIKELNKTQELTPNQTEELAKETLNKVNSNENFANFNKLDDELQAKEKQREEEQKRYEEEKKKLYEEYSKDPNWTYGKQEPQKEQEEKRLSPEEKRELEFQSKLEQLEKDHKKELDKIEKEKEELKKEMSAQVDKIMKSDSFDDLLQNLKSLDNAIIAILQNQQKQKEQDDDYRKKGVNLAIDESPKMNEMLNGIEKEHADKKKELGIESDNVKITNYHDLEKMLKELNIMDKQLGRGDEDEKKRLERVNEAFAESPQMKEIITSMLKEQNANKKELEKEQKEFGLAKDQAEFIKKKVDDYQQTNNPNAKMSFIEDIEKVLKSMDKAKELEKQGTKDPKEKELIKQMKKLETHFPKTIERAKNTLDKHIKERDRQKTNERTNTQQMAL